jgi:Putative ABC exporter
MHPALAKLIALSVKSSIRRTFRGARTVKGALLLLFSFGVLALMIVPSLVGAAFMRSAQGLPQFSQWIEPYVPLAILGFCLLMIFGPAGEMAIAFTPAETEFLFPGPFSRRELIIYKLVKLLLGGFFLALLLSVTCLIYFRSWLAAFVGIFLTMEFMQLLALVVALAGQIVAEHAYTRSRKLSLLVVGALVAAGLAQMLWQTPVTSIPALALAFRGTWTGRVVLAPFEVFSAAMLAVEWFPELLCWGALAAAINLGLVAVILKLDADYLEGAAAVSQRIYERRQRIRASGGMALPASQKATRLRVPRLPWWGGAGPLAWRQLLMAMRTSQTLIMIFLVFGGGYLAAALLIPLDAESKSRFATFGVGGLAYISFIFTMQLPWAFRGDIDHMALLKTLPVKPLALAAGELAGTIIVLATIQLVLLAGLLTVGANPVVILVAAAYIVPFDLLMLGVGNVLFLLYPVRLNRTTAADFQLFGRAMLFALLQFLILVPALGIPAAAGGIAFFVSGYHWLVFAGVSLVVLVAELPVLLLILGSVFERFDPSTETPA